MLLCWTLVGQRARAFYYQAPYALIYYYNDFVKIAYHDSRPFWEGPDVKGWFCSDAFGNPSGHANVSMAMTLVVWLDVCHSFKLPIWAKILLLGVCFALTGTIGYSRLYLGAHSLNQVIYGWMVGAWFALTWHFCVRERFFQHYEDL